MICENLVAVFVQESKEFFEQLRVFQIGRFSAHSGIGLRQNAAT